MAKSYAKSSTSSKSSSGRTASSSTRAEYEKKQEAKSTAAGGAASPSVKADSSAYWSLAKDKAAAALKSISDSGKADTSAYWSLAKDKAAEDYRVYTPASSGSGGRKTQPAAAGGSGAKPVLSGAWQQADSGASGSPFTAAASNIGKTTGEYIRQLQEGLAELGRQNTAAGNYISTLGMYAAGEKSPDRASGSTSAIDSPAGWQALNDRDIMAFREAEKTGQTDSSAYWQRAKDERQAAEQLLKDTTRSAIPPYTPGSFLSAKELAVKKEAAINQELEKLEQAKSLKLSVKQQKEIERRIANLNQQLNTLDARAGRVPKWERDKSANVSKEETKSLDSGKAKVYTENEGRSPEFTYDISTGKYITYRTGNATVVENLAELMKEKSNEPQKSYVIYTSEGSSDFTRQAEYQREQLEAAGKDVEMIEVNSLSEFLNAWTSMGRSADEVVILSHARSHALIFDDGSPTDAISVNGKNLSGETIANIHSLYPLNINTLTLLGCNTGNLDAADTDKGNPAQAFAALGGIGKVVAFDGSVGYSEKGSGAVEKVFGEVYPYDWMYPRQSSNQADFWDNQYNLYPQKFIPEEMDLRYPQGQVVYNSNGETEEVIGWPKAPKKK